MNIYFLAGITGVTLFLLFFFNEQTMAANHPFIMNMAANAVVAIIFIFVYLALPKEK